MALGRFDDREMCDGWLERMDLFVEDIAAQLGISVPTTKIPISILKYEMTTKYCKKDPVSGCYLRDGATDAPHLVVAIDDLIAVYHELVHFIVIEWGDADGHAFYDEGMAEALSEDSTSADELTTPTALRDVLDNPEDLENRLCLNVFFKHLFAVYGVPTVLEWGQSLNRDESETKLLDQFRRVFGKTIEEEWDTDWFVRENMRASSAQCLAPENANPGIPWKHRFADICDDEEMSYIDFIKIQRFARLEIPETGDYLVLSDGRGIIDFTSCSATAETNAIMGLERHFEAGTYGVSALFSDFDSDAYTDVQIVPLRSCDPFNDTCPDDQKCYRSATSLPSCYPQSGPLQEEGAPCEYPDYFSPDSCEKGLRCSYGYCQPTCRGSSIAPECPADHTCYFENPVQPFTGSGFGLPGICVQECNPLSGDCPPERQCLWSPLTDEFVCGNLRDETVGKVGDTDCLLTSCQEGLYCRMGEEEADLGVCASVCDLSAPSPDDTCPDGGAFQQCLPHPTLDQLGYCQNR